MLRSTLLAMTMLAAATGANAAERRFTVSGFDAVEAAGPFDVVVTVGKGYSVRAVGSAADLDRLKVEVSGRELEIGAKDRSWFRSYDWGEVTFYVTLPAIRAASIAGSGDMTVDRVRGERFAGSIAGSGDLRIAAIDAPTTTFSVAGSGDLIAAGKCRSATVSIAGSGDVDTTGLRCEALKVSIAGSGDVGAHASRTATVSIVGSGNVRVAGGAKCDVSKMGSGTVSCG